MKSVKDLKTVSSNVKSLAEAALSETGGLLRLAPCWVPRSFLQPGKRLKLHPEDLYAFGLNRGGIDERWFGSHHARRQRQPHAGRGAQLRRPRRRARSRCDAVAANWAARSSATRSGTSTRSGRSTRKFFDNMGPIPHHMHQIARAGGAGRRRRASRRATTSRRSTTTSATTSPTPSWASSPARPRRRSASAWRTGTRATTASSTSRKAYRLKPGTGWLIRPCILHAPGSLVHLRAAVGQRRLRHVPVAGRGPRGAWALLVKDMPKEKHQRPGLHRRAARLGGERRPELQGTTTTSSRSSRAGSAKEGYVDRWIVYGKVDGEQLFTRQGTDRRARRRRCTIKDNGANSIIAVQGEGRINKLRLSSPKLIRLPRADRGRGLRHRDGRQGRRDLREHQRRPSRWSCCATSGPR